jgi:hypothetical protein
MRRDAPRATRARPSRRHGVARGAAVMDVDGEVDALVDAVRRLGDVDAGGKRLFASRATDGAMSRDRATQVKFGALVRDDEVANTFEALNGTLRAAKKRGKLTFAGELLLQGAHDDVDVVVVESAGAT